MSRFARFIAPGLPHHVTQRGNRRAQLFFIEDDDRSYFSRLQMDSARRGLAILVIVCCLITSISLRFLTRSGV